MDDDLGTPFRDFVELFERLGIPYALIGGWPSACMAFPARRMISTSRSHWIAVASVSCSMRRSSSATRSRRNSPEAGLTKLAGCRWFEFANGCGGRSVDIDIFLAETRLQESLLARRSRLEVDGVPAWVVSPEDLILLKLIASRPRDIGDVMDILMAQGQLDEEYLRRWATELGLLDALNRVMNEMQF